MTIRNLPPCVTLITTEIYCSADGALGDITAGRRCGVLRQDDQDRWERGNEKRGAEGTAARGDGVGEVGGINRNKDKGQWRESGGQQWRRRVEGTEVRVCTARTEDDEVPFCFLLYNISAAAAVGNFVTTSQGPSAAAAAAVPHDDCSAGTEP